VIDVAVARVNVRVDEVDATTMHVLRCRWYHNLVVDSGLNMIRDRLAGVAVDPITHGAVGTDASATIESDTALRDEVFRDQLGQRSTASAKSLVCKFVIGAQQANGSVLREAALFNASSGGSMFARVVTEEVVKTDAVLVVYTWTLSFEASS